MASICTRPRGVPLPSILEPPSVVVSDGEPSPTSDGAADEEQLYIDQDDAQSIIQPALSPVATRLTLPRTPAAEKAAALERLPGGGLFSVIEGTATPDPEPSPVMGQSSETLCQTTMNKASTRQARGHSLGQLPSSHSPTYRFPSPWQSGPKQMVVQNESGSPKPTLSAVFGQDTHRRSSSGGADTLKRLREALPSMPSMPSMPSISLQSFFSGPSSVKSPGPDVKKTPPLSNDGVSEPKQFTSFLVDTPSPSSRSKLQSANRQSLIALPIPSAEGSALPRPPNRPRAIRRSTSDESMLYHSLSRVSSLGDDDRWHDIREQKNSRLKAITDSWDRPTFKLPQLPNIIPAPLKKNSLGPDQSDSSLSGVMRASTIFETGPSTPKDDNLSDLDRALELLTGDIVIMGGYRGSVLRSTKTNRQVWVPVKLGLNIRKANLEVGLDPEDEERMEETIYASGMLKNIGPVDISKRLFKRLRECENARTGKLRVWDYGYDWRLSPHLLSRRLVKFLEQLPSNQGKGSLEDRGAMVIAHSLGGLITRHAVNQRPDLFSGVTYAGTPQRCINILGPIRNGDAVLFNEKVLTAQVHFSLRTTFTFLPEDGFCFINKHTGEQYPVDFYDPQEWVKYCWSPCIEPCLPSSKSRSSALNSLRELSERLPAPLRSRGNSAASESRPPTRNVVAEAARKADVVADKTLAPQMGTLQGDSQQQPNPDAGSRSANFTYLARTLAETKQFREETKHRPEHTMANKYPPLAVIYGKEVPTVWAVSVASREVISCADAYDDLVFRSGDGVVLAREAMLPEGYELARDGRVSTDRGHITLLGDLEAVGRALLAVARGRRKGIGLGALS
ncbi:hypothetical protein F4781DRAFT_170134 [Annulohypoxylon bovei var. microspora]|nr:hypothetical protein F4781DRAFT_170134 [Annulohypoxylon bovei var. microspora]